MSDALGRKDDLVVYLTRAIASCEETDRRRPAEGMATDLISARRTLAWGYCERGDRERAGPLFAANHCLAERLTSESEDLERSTRCLVSHIEWKLFIDGSTSAPARGTEANPSGVACPLASLASTADASQSPREWARIAAEALHSTHADVGGGAKDGQAVMAQLAEFASKFRRQGEPEKARRITERKLALAECFNATWPDRPEAHLAAAQAYLQISKDGRQNDDQRAIEDNLMLALAAAKEALRPGPGSEEAQRQIDSIQSKLDGLRDRTHSTIAD